MKILYAFQGTGNGHISRARDIIPIIQQLHEVDVLISGIQSDIELSLPIKYKFTGLSFIFGKKGGVDVYETYKKSNLRELFIDINTLPVNDYDLIINDFEPVSAWACYINNKPCISISHQAAVLHKKAPKPKDFDVIGKAVLINYDPTSMQYGFHFQSYSDSIFTPVIRKQIRDCIVQNKGHITVYLPAYDDNRIVKILKEFPDIRWEVFSKHNKSEVEYNNIMIRPISNDAFVESMTTSEGVLCGAGFETPAEALFLKKKLLVIPMKGQYEQQCNAAALKQMGVTVIKSLKQKHIDKIGKWLASSKVIPVEYPDNTASIIQHILVAHANINNHKPVLNEKITSLKDFKKMFLKKIVKQLGK